MSRGYHAYVRLGMGIPESEFQLREIILALMRAGSTGPIFYNYSEAPRRMLNWVKASLAEV